MHPFLKKLKLVFVPFLVIALCIICEFLFLFWLLRSVIRIHSAEAIQSTVFYTCLASTAVALFVWYNPKIKRLSLKGYKREYREVFVFVAGMTIMVIFFPLLDYLEGSTANLTELDNISQIVQQPANEQYKIGAYYIDTSQMGMSDQTSISGYRNSNSVYNIEVFVVMPMFPSITDTTDSTCITWCALHFSKAIDNNLSQDIKDNEVASFRSSSLSYVKQGSIDRFGYFARIGTYYEEDQSGYLAATYNTQTRATAGTIFLEPSGGPTSTGSSHTIELILKIFGAGCIALFILSIFSRPRGSAPEA